MVMMPVAMQTDLIGKTVEIRSFRPYAHNPPDHEGIPGIVVASGIVRAVGALTRSQGSPNYTYPMLVIVLDIGSGIVNPNYDHSTIGETRPGFLVPYLISHSYDGENTLAVRVVEPKP